MATIIALKNIYSSQTIIPVKGDEEKDWVIMRHGELECTIYRGTPEDYVVVRRISTARPG